MIVRADSRDIPLRSGCVQCVVTSPPYWGLRDYGVAGQIGLEPTPEAYVETIVHMFREVRRVLRDDGTLWLNLGDSYAAGGNGGGGSFAKDGIRCAEPGTDTNERAWWRKGRKRPACGLKPKDLCGIPWRVAFALQADGWYLRADIIWAKPNPMPESVTDRPTRSHEYIFLLTKSAQYFYDADAIREAPAAYERPGGAHPYTAEGVHTNGVGSRSFHQMAPDGRNKRDVWTINSEPLPDAHFATFPRKLVEPCVLAGSRVGDLVLDPFLGSGTLGVVCERFGRRWVGLELSEPYIAIARRRTAQTGLRARANNRLGSESKGERG